MKAPHELRCPEDEGPLAPEGGLVLSASKAKEMLWQLGRYVNVLSMIGFDRPSDLSRKYLEIKICEFSS